MDKKVAVKQKADELYKKMYNIIGVQNREGATGRLQALWIPEKAKQCALNAIDEIISEGRLFFSSYDEMSRYDFWQQVKEEIESIQPKARKKPDDLEWDVYE
jgi:hypothetical protein